VFHGHAIALHVDAGSVLDPSRVLEWLARGEGLRVAEDRARATPVETGDEEETLLFEVASDGLGGVWIWAVAGAAEMASARRAVHLARTMAGLGS